MLMENSKQEYSVAWRRCSIYSQGENVVDVTKMQKLHHRCSFHTDKRGPLEYAQAMEHDSDQRDHQGGVVAIESDDKKRFERAVSELNDNSVDELIDQAKSKLATVPARGPVGPLAAAPAVEEK
ncbi:hypothetical protein WA026_013624 [Henosepilachna vigintioctopunctata]|uniref:Uncharacterized protein n=1 Tax=Henosepilachna vigintioctopunctata TaxID=420089 RepID=A0AAW1V0J1_9CUCU